MVIFVASSHHFWKIECWMLRDQVLLHIDSSPPRFLRDAHACGLLLLAVERQAPQGFVGVQCYLWQEEVSFWDVPRERAPSAEIRADRRSPLTEHASSTTDALWKTAPG